MAVHFKALTPMLHTNDIDSTIDWWTSVLGFECVAREGNGWCRLRRDDVALMFMHNAHLGSPAATATQYIYVDDVRSLWEQIRHRVSAEWGPETMSYGMIEFAVKDPNGYLVSFGQPSSAM
jgi:catechol 2,3-dioxygenase-like lactoylglutathione lyase family enzyme